MYVYIYRYTFTNMYVCMYTYKHAYVYMNPNPLTLLVHCRGHARPHFLAFGPSAAFALSPVQAVSAALQPKAAASLRFAHGRH